MSTGINDPNRCQYCGNFHQFKCPLIKAFEYKDGAMTRVEFYAPKDYPPLEARESITIAKGAG